MSNKMVVQGFTFRTKEEYSKAKKEQEAIAYIKANTDLMNMKNRYKLYCRLNSKETFQTIIGVQFLSELRESLLKANFISEEQLEPVLVTSTVVEKAVLPKNVSANRQADSKFSSLYEKQKHKKELAYVVIGFLSIIIAGMIIISYTGNHSNLEMLENKIIDKYSAWEAELEEKEAELNQKEEQLEAR